MKYTENRIYTQIADAIKLFVPKCQCYSRYTETVSKFPAAFIYAVDTTDPQRYRTLAGDGSVWQPTIEVQLFSNLKSGAKAETETMANAVREALRSMQFRITSARPVLNGDPSIYRYIIRASRMIGEADEMPEKIE